MMVMGLWGWEEGEGGGVGGGCGCEWRCEWGYEKAGCGWGRVR